MNKILMNNIDTLLNGNNLEDNGIYFLGLNNTTEIISFRVSENKCITLNIFGMKTNLNLDVELSKNSTLILQNFMIEGTINIKAKLEEKANLISNLSVFSKENSHNCVSVKHIGKKSVSKLKNHGFSLNKANLIFDVASYISKEAKSCISHQDNQIIENTKCISQINPNLYIDNYDVDASHSAYVGEFKEQELFYLMSRGISLEKSKFLLLKAFLLGCFDLDIETYELFQEEFLKYYSEEVKYE